MRCRASSAARVGPWVAGVLVIAMVSGPASQETILAQAPPSDCVVTPVTGSDGTIRWCTVCVSGGVVTILECR